MQKEKMFQDSGKWYKGNLHAHTVYSDGKLTPEQVIQMYKQHGYSFMCLSEHDFFTDWSNEYNSEKFILAQTEKNYKTLDFYKQMRI